MFTRRIVVHAGPVSARFTNGQNMDLKTVVKKIEEFAPLKLAKDWDNVGLLVEPSTKPHIVSHILLTNDLTLKVVEEAISRKASMIISYHPPIFHPIKRLTQFSWKETAVIKCIEKQIAVYSPHTCWDVVDGGTNDWLISPFNGKTKPLSIHKEQRYKAMISFGSSGDIVSKAVVDELSKLQSGEVIFNGSSVSLICSKHQLKVIEGLPADCSIEIQEFPHAGYGEGRCVLLDIPMKIKDVLVEIKKHLGVNKVQLALGYQLNEDSLVTSLAVCAGSGGSVLKGVEADVLITGEMSHHEVLDVCHQREGKSCVILCGHSNTERGFLSVVMQKIQESLDGSVGISLSNEDCDPLKIV